MTSQPSLPKQHLATPVGSFDCHSKVEGATGTSWAEARDTSKHHTMYRTVPHSKELAGPRCQ